jgi:uncharacterized OB-fold protein
MSFANVPAIEPNALTSPFWDACKRHELIVQYCEACQNYQYPPMHYCGNCQHKNPQWRKSPGIGEIHSSTTVYRPQTPAFEAPYVVALIRLDEGWHIVSNIVGCDPADATIGKRVRVVFTSISGGFVLPHFGLIE